MKFQKFLLFTILSIFLITSVSAATFLATSWEDGSATRTIEDGESAEFDVYASCADPALTISIKLYNSDEEDIHTFQDETIQDSVGVEHVVINPIYEIDKSIYGNAGDFEVRIEYSDAAQNPQYPVQILTLTINPLPDITAPIIELIGDSAITIEVGSEYIDAGATASDDVDGDLAVVIGGDTVDVNTLGTYIITYDATDSSGNIATQITRTVNVVDTTTPVIILNGDNPVDVVKGTTYTDAGATATDNYDGDLTGIVIVNPVNTDVAGTYIITYDVSDSSGNAATQVTRTVNVIAEADTTAPTITLLGDSTITIEVGDSYTDAGATAYDDVDGDITDDIETANPVNVNVLGTYTVTYTVSDSAGNSASATRTVNVVDTTIPIITITGDSTITIEVGDSYIDAGATAYDDVDGDITTNIATVNPVDINVVGVYTITYDVSDAAGNAATQITRTVNVVEPEPTPNTAPEITSSPVTQVYEGETYNYQVTATDADGDTLTYSASSLPSGISINSNTGLITGTAPGVDDDTNYSITVQVSDGNGGSDTQPYTLTVKNVVPGNNDPIITTTAVTQVDENQNYSYDVDATDPDGDALTYSLTENPTWLSINSNTGLITGTAPEVASDTNYGIIVQVSDGNGGSDTQTYILTVNVIEDDDDTDDEDDTEEDTDFYEQLYLDQFEPNTIYLDEEEEEIQLSWLQKIIKAIVDFFKRLFG